MRTRYACALNGVEIGELDASVLLIDIDYNTPSRQLTTTRLAGSDGQRMMRDVTDSVSVLVTFEIHEHDIERRAAVCEQVQRWAMEGGILTTADKPERQLRVVCETPPAIGSALKWTSRLNILFTAYERPFWEDRYPTRVTINGNGSADVYAPGFAAPAVVDGRVKNTGANAVNSLTLRSGNTFFTFESLALAAGKTLEFGYDSRNILFIRADGQSALLKRTPASSDGLALQPGGMRKMSVTADGSVSASFEIRGMYI